MKIETANTKKLIRKQQVVQGRVYRHDVSKDIYLCIGHRILVSLSTAEVVDYEDIINRHILEEVEAKVVIDA